MNFLGAEGLLEPGGDVSTFGGRGDLGSAQAGYPGGLDQYQEQMRKRALGTKWTKKQPVQYKLCITEVFGSVKELYVI